VRTILIAGLGLIGGSAGKALRRRGWRVLYFDPFVAEPGDAADQRVHSLEAEADLVLLATPLDVAREQINLPTTVVTSACSVMRPLRVGARGTFIAGHPMAGSEQSGLTAADANLFEGKNWFVDDDHELVDALIRDCGAVRHRVTAEEHDAGVALTSHLPQVLSTALAAFLDERDVLRFAGSGLSTFLRLAGSNASIWGPVIDANRDHLAPHADEVARIVRAILDGNTEAFEKARRLRSRL
jgi:prephenate dehydrogenase